MQNKAAFITVVLVLSLFSGYGISRATGYWRTESSKIPAKISSGEFAGENDPGDIRGSYSFDDIDAAFGIPPDITAAAFGLTGENPGSFQAKSLEAAWGELDEGVEIGTDAVRLFTALWCGLPYDTEEKTVLPEAAVDILEINQRIDETKARELRVSAVKLPEAGTAEETAENEDNEDHLPPDRKVRGLTTFGELRGWGVSDEMWQKEFGLPMGGKADSMKDWAEDTGLSMSEIRNAAQDMVDSGA